MLFSLNANSSINCKKFAAAKTPHKLRAEFDNRASYQQVYTNVLKNLGDHRKQLSWHSHFQARGNPSQFAHIIDAAGNAGLGFRKLMLDSPTRFVEIFDLSSEALAEAKNSGIPNTQLHKSNILHLQRSNQKNKVSAESVDGVQSSNAVYMLSKPEFVEFLVEAHRVLKVGGIFTLSSMKHATKLQSETFLRSMKEEIQKMEENSRVSKGASAIFFEANKKLMTKSPTKHDPGVVIKLAELLGFEYTEGSYAQYYNSNGYFLAFKKASNPKPNSIKIEELLKYL